MLPLERVVRCAAIVVTAAIRALEADIDAALELRNVSAYVVLQAAVRKRVGFLTPQAA
jgi:hypothetical protein